MTEPETLAILLKSYAGDFGYAARLVKSFNEFNREDLSLYVVVPSSDLEAFANLASRTVTVLDEALFAEHLTSVDINGYRAGYINQEIVKLAFWELGLCENYFLVDSDAVFLRPFGVSDFMYDRETPFTILSEDAELQVEPEYYEKYWEERKHMIMRIPETIGFEPRLFITCHGHAIFSAKVLRSFKQDFLQARGWGYLDAIREVPFEFSWYNMWIQARQTIPIHMREPIVKTYHNSDQHLEHVLKRVTPSDLARGYVAVVVNSNYSRGIGQIGVDQERPETLAFYLTYSDLFRVLRVKIKRALRRLTRTA
jgi:hypothetical protein